MEPRRTHQHPPRPLRLSRTTKKRPSLRAFRFEQFKLFLWFDFVAAEVFLCFGENNVLAQFFAVFAEAQLFRSVHGVLAGVIYALAGLFTHETNQFALFVLLCHIPYILTDTYRFVKQYLHVNLNSP